VTARRVLVGLAMLCACGRLRYDLVDGDGDGGEGGVPGSGGALGAGGAGGGPGDAGSSDATDGGAIACAPQSFGVHDYLFCDALRDWATARAECEARGMRLVRIDDAPENAWVAATAVFSAAMRNRDALWLGGYEPTTDGDWHWTDGQAFWLGAANGMAVGGLYVNWDSREPNNAVGPESCMSMPLNGSTWFDYQCSYNGYFACERY